jgi:hypothetical protein
MALPHDGLPSRGRRERPGRHRHGPVRQSRRRRNTTRAARLPGILALTDQLAPYVAAATKLALDELQAEHARQRERERPDGQIHRRARLRFAQGRLAELVPESRLPTWPPSLAWPWPPRPTKSSTCENPFVQLRKWSCYVHIMLAPACDRIDAIAP